MSVFLNEGTIAIESFPKQAQDEVSNQNQLMKFIASALYRNGEKIDSALQALRTVKNKMPKIHMICFEYDIFYPQSSPIEVNVRQCDNRL